MKTGIHPQYFTDAKVKCACGAVLTIGSTVESYSVDVCAQCHPFYTGEQRLVDTAGRVDRFKARFEAAAKLKAEADGRGDKKKKETLEEKMTRKAEEKTAAKEEEKAKKEESKKKSAKKAAEKLTVEAKKEEGSEE